MRTARATLCRVAAGLLFGMLAASAEAGTAAWDGANLDALRSVILSAADEGLDPADYDLAGLDAAIAAGAPELPQVADASALRLAHDLFEGRRDLRARPSWHFDRAAVDYRRWLDSLLAAHSIQTSFSRLLPAAAEYRQLRTSLAACGRSHADCSWLRANLDRWRALPRDFESRYLWVNVPAFRVDLIENGRIVGSHRIIVGKEGSRTPLFKASISGITANPWWNVPCSIVDESIGKLVRDHPAEAARKGYVASTDKRGKLVVRQTPGPGNALGRIKFEMPNPYGVYLHDTPTRELFQKDVRALSHGCIRTDQPDVLARRLLGPARSRELDAALLGFATRTIPLPASVPVYVVYLTAEVERGASGGVGRHPDIYKEDARDIRAMAPALNP